jgi:hypothetical protein
MAVLRLGQEAGFIGLPVGQGGFNGCSRRGACILALRRVRRGGLGGRRRRGALGEAAAAFGLAAVVQHQRVAFDQQQGQREHVVDRPALEFQFHLAQRLAALPGQDLAFVNGDFDDATRGACDVADLALELGAELGLQLVLEGLEHRPKSRAFERPPFKGRACNRELDFLALVQARAAAAAALGGLQPVLAVAAQAQANARLGKRALRRVEVDVVQLMACGAGAAPQRVGAQCGERVRGQPELEFDFHVCAAANVRCGRPWYCAPARLARWKQGWRRARL